MEASNNESCKILGLDIGSNSVGWALVDSKKQFIIRTGVRIFEEGVTGDIEKGRDESRSKKRRDQRQMRRQTWRMRRRKAKLLHCLQMNGLFPEGDLSRTIHQIDQFFLQKYFQKTGASPDQKHEAAQKAPYLMRARGLDDELELREFGRVLYHLCQRRGFKSMRKGAAPENSDEGKVKAGINSLSNSMLSAKSRTLGEFFATLDPEETRIRTHYTSRAMYEDEFSRLWESQKKFHPEILTDVLRQEIHKTIFFQRPLKSVKHLIGKCSLEKNRPRAALSLLHCQKFRYLQRLNDTSVITQNGAMRPLSTREKAVLGAQLDQVAQLTHKQALKLLEDDNLLGLHTADDKVLIGNRTADKMRKALDAKWDALSEEKQNQLIDDLRSFTNVNALEKRLRTVWEFTPEERETLLGMGLEPGYANLSTKAIKRLLPLIEQGKPYATAVKEIYGLQLNTGQEPHEFLPPFLYVNPSLKNPMVIRSLTELRKVVNAIVHAYGKPDIIRVELARDLKNSPKIRKKIHKRNLDNQAQRKKAIAKIFQECGQGFEEPRKRDILKALLWDECGGQCPYSGEMIPFKPLFGDHPEFDIEHIIPLSRSLDNSFLNLTLCKSRENRQVKANRTPFEAYGSTDEWENILHRVKKFQGPAAKKKLALFQTEEARFDEFAHRQLNDTAYASREAIRYLGFLYGGEIDAQGKRRVQVSRGGVTKFIRDQFNLNSILNDGGSKSRDDHRHHAVDALATCFADYPTTKLLSNAAKSAWSKQRRLFDRIEPPWMNFTAQAQESILSILVSHRINRRVRGPLHEETLYSPAKIGNGKKDGVVRIRKPIQELTSKELGAGSWLDERIKRAVLEKLKALGDDNPKTAFASPENHPVLLKNGKSVPIHKVRIQRNQSVEKIGKGNRQRFVSTGSGNHHIEIRCVKKVGSEPCWIGQTISLLEARQRLSKGEPVVNRDCNEEESFVMSLAAGDLIEIDDERGRKSLCRVRTAPKSLQVMYVDINDARKQKDIKSTGAWKSKKIEPLRLANCKKVVITALGDVRRAND